jgi:hypothetical protein
LHFVQASRKPALILWGGCSGNFPDEKQYTGCEQSGLELFQTVIKQKTFHSKVIKNANYLFPATGKLPAFDVHFL